MNTNKTPQHEKIRVYVTSYRKYNEGTLTGGWVTLNNYKTPEDFWAACRKLLRNERDPEFMFPDYEVPDFLGGLITESSIDTDAIWEYLNNAVQPDEDAETPEYSKAQLKEWKAEYIEYRLANDSWHAAKDKEKHDAYWRPFYEKKYLTVIKLGDDYYPIEKLRIQTTFCFGAGCNGISTDEDWEGASAAQSAIHQFDNWLKANTEEVDSDIIGLTDPHSDERRWRDRGYLPFVCRYEKEIKLLWRYSLCGDMPDDAHAPSPKEKAVILAGLKMQLSDITKRCTAYWKRYGASKLNTWTYLRD